MVYHLFHAFPLFPAFLLPFLLLFISTRISFSIGKLALDTGGFPQLHKEVPPSWGFPIVATGMKIITDLH